MLWAALQDGRMYAILVDGRRRGLHDTLAGTLVVGVP